MKPHRRRGSSAILPDRRRPEIDILIESPLWATQRRAKEVLHRALEQAFSAVPAVAGELAVVLTDDAALRALNRKWRGQNRATNVLSFPPQVMQWGHGTPRPLGDIVIAYETTEREARAQGKPFMHHLAHLAVHGYLHLMGYDHEAEDQAEAMESLETRILARLEMPDPYIVRGDVVDS
jgi:probable rRNA maturation factor